DGIFLDSSNNNALLTGNTVHGCYIGINAEASGAIVSANNVYLNSNYGLDSDYGSNIPGIVFTGNTVHDNAHAGINVYNNNVLVIGNTVYGQIATYAVGIAASSGQVQQNVVFDNYDGIYSTGYYASSATISGNRVYANSHFGIHTYSQAVPV